MAKPNKIYFVGQDSACYHENTKIRYFREVMNIQVIVFSWPRVIFENNLFTLSKKLPRSPDIFNYARYLIWLALKVIVIPKKSTIWVHGILESILLNMLSIVCLKNFRIISEISDIPSRLETNSFIVRFYSVLTRNNVIVLTSILFESVFKWDPLKIAVKEIQNKIHFPFRDKIMSNNSSWFAPKSNTDFIVIGFMGNIRCIRSLRILEALTRKSSKFRVVLIGQLYDEKIVDFVSNNNRAEFKFYGSYNGYDDHVFLQFCEKIDLLWAVYPFTNEQVANQYLAKTNRFNESVEMLKPIIVRSGTADALRVMQFQNGWIIDSNCDDEEIIECVCSINKDKLYECVNLTENIPNNEYCISEEYNFLYHT